MDDIKLEISAEEIKLMLKSLSEKELNKVIKKSLSKSINILKKQTISNLKTVVSNVYKKDKNNKTLAGGVRAKVYKNAEGKAIVHIMSNFKLKFFELGTKDRYNIRKGNKQLIKKRFVGRIIAHKFFESAQIQKEQEVFDSINKNVLEIIKDINNKRYNK